MTTNAVIAKNVVLKLGDGADPEVFTALAEMTGLGAPGFSAEAVDATHLNSGDYREFIQGLADAGEISGTMQWNPTDHATVAALENAGTKNFEMEFAGTHKFSFSGFLTAFNPSFSVGEKATADVTWKVTGQPTFGAIS